MYNFDIIIIGAGHAGCESALSSARLGNKTLLLATNLDTVGYLACNPSIGGTAKGQIVKEIDALGGQMAINADSALLQMRMLNRGKGPAVYSPRAQVDKHQYHFNMKNTIETCPNLTLRQCEATAITEEDGGYVISTNIGLTYHCRAVVVASGVYLNSRTLIGECISNSGPNGFANATHLTKSIAELGHKIMRFKTGTPARVALKSINLDVMSKQDGESDSQPFSYMTDSIAGDKRSCYLTYSTPLTKRIILENKHLAPLYNGSIDGTGPRYCPSIEDKVIRFADKERHQIFLEPEELNGNEYYVQGASTSMPSSVQIEMYHSIEGLEDVIIMRDAYAIEYDCIDATELDNTLMSKKHKGLFFAGQVCGTSGYEEAGAQGLVAGINASRYVSNLSPMVLTRTNSYIGVLIDDITTKQSTEPYRMMTSRAEHRLLLRQDNADIRLTQIGRDIGLVSDERYAKFERKLASIADAHKQLEQIIPPAKLAPMFSDLSFTLPGAGIALKDLLKRKEINFQLIRQYFNLLTDIDDEALAQVEIDIKYSGYIEKQKTLIAQAEKLESKLIPADINYLDMDGLRLEARQKLNAIRPTNIGQAGRISGVSPADIQILIVYLQQHKHD